MKLKRRALPPAVAHLVLVRWQRSLVRRKRPFHIFALGVIAAIPSAWFLAGESGLATMIVMIVLTFVYAALFEVIWRRLTGQD
jgi:uncharacterized membrane protein